MTFTDRPTPAGRMGRADKGISSPFGYSPGYRGGKYMHHGQDYYWLYADVAGSRQVFAAGAGTVAEVYWDGVMGGCVVVDHHDGVRSRYCHMPQGSALVSVGDKVTTATHLGPMGNSGSAAFGEYHLHFEAWVGGDRVDPEPYFTAPLADNQRRVNSGGLFTRSAPTTASTKGALRKPGEVLVLVAYTTGELVDGVATWAKDASGSWYWMGGFTDTGTHGLALEPPVEPPPVEPPPVEPPPVEPPPVEPPPVEPPPVEPPPVEPPPVEPPPVKRSAISAAIVAFIALVGGILALIFGTH